MERADWLDAGFDPVQARFLMVTAITHHRFGARIWGESEVLKLYAELADIDESADREARAEPAPRYRPYPADVISVAEEG